MLLVSAKSQHLTQGEVLGAQVGPEDDLVMLRPTTLAPGQYLPLPRPVAADVEGWTPKARRCWSPPLSSWCCRWKQHVLEETLRHGKCPACCLSNFLRITDRMDDVWWHCHVGLF